MQIWDNIVSTALLGTEREPAAPFTADGALGDALERLVAAGGSGGEAMMLRLAAMIELYERAGHQPPDAPGPLDEPCLDDKTGRLCASRAGAHLSTLIEEENEALLSEWLIAARSVEKTVPPILLPPLLELGRTRKHLRTALIMVCDERMRWLARRNPDWAYVLEVQAQQSAADYKNIWETGDISERAATLRALRTTAPATARELLLSTWAEDPPETRATFLSEWHTVLSMDDEPFLEERALDDKRKEVRTKAIDLLTLLPDSRLSQRMIARVCACVIVTARGIEVLLPPDCDKSMVRDGIVQKRATQLGDKADWLAQMLGYVRPSYWTEKSSTTITTLIQSANSNTDWHQVLLTGWQTAVVTHKDREWAMALVPHATQDLVPLFQCLDDKQREALIIEAMKHASELADGKSHYAHVLHMVLRGEELRSTLSPEASRALLSACKMMTAPAGTHIYQNPVLVILPSLALRLNPALAEDALSGWPDSYMQLEYSRKIMDQFMHTVQFRREMHLALRE